MGAGALRSGDAGWLRSDAVAAARPRTRVRATVIRHEVSGWKNPSRSVATRATPAHAAYRAGHDRARGSTCISATAACSSQIIDRCGARDRRADQRDRRRRVAARHRRARRCFQARPQLPGLPVFAASSARVCPVPTLHRRHARWRVRDGQYALRAFLRAARFDQAAGCICRNRTDLVFLYVYVSYAKISCTLPGQTSTILDIGTGSVVYSLPVLLYRSYRALFLRGMGQ
jgi:hypothetical protein